MSIYSVIEPFYAISCVDFAKPCLALQSSCARRANCGLLYYWLEPFNCGAESDGCRSHNFPFGLKGLRNQKWLRKTTLLGVYPLQPPSLNINGGASSPVWYTEHHKNCYKILDAMWYIYARLVVSCSRVDLVWYSRWLMAA